MDRQEALLLARVCLPKLQAAAVRLKSPAISANEVNVIISDRDVKQTTLCRVWAGMGYIYELSLLRGKYRFVVKRVVVSPPSGGRQRLSFGDERKARSYQVEANFYENVAPWLLQKGIRIPQPLHVERDSECRKVTICMSKVEGRVGGGLSNIDENKAALRWLAAFHSATWDYKDDVLHSAGLQPTASYWHLDTRPEEHTSMSKTGWEGRLRRAARAIDSRLKRDKMQCLCHGDAKDANMIWPHRRSSDEVSVAFCDFQYCGKGPPTVDLAYFLCVAAVNVEKTENYLIEYYYEQLSGQLRSLGVDAIPSLQELQESLLIAYCDFSRFMCGWGWWGTDISHKVISVLDRLDGGKDLGSEDAYQEAMLLHFG
jgi:hypothetical protein